tara:strand:- start:22 stop:1551 length:1530 start_codon:yes stop_codon:yes gene_type:complete
MAIIYHAGRRLQGLSTDFQTSGLKAYWKMNEASGNLLNTASAQSSDSTMSADLVSSGTVNRGRTGHISGVDCIGFPTYDADGNKVTANNSASDYGFMNKAGAKFTACWWAKNYSYNNTIDQWGLDGNGNATDISFRSLSSGFTVWFAGTEYTGFTHNVGDANWHFYMLSWDEDGGSNNAQFQLDGVKQTATVTTTNTSNSNSPLTIGDVSGNEPQMDIQEFSLWNRVLTDAEIALIYNSGNGAELQNTTIVGSKPTNVQVGSRLEETDTRKIYHYESATPTFEDDFSISSGWVVSGSQFTVDTSTDERLEYALKRTGNTNDYVYKDLQDSDALGSGINASDTEWVLRYHMVHTSDTGNNSKNTPAIMGLSSTNNGYLDTQDYIGVRLETGETPQYSASSGDGGSANTMTDFSQFQTAYPLTGTDDFYVEIKRISSTEFTVEFFSDSGYTISVEKETVTTLNSTVDNLRYLVIKVGYGTADDDTLNGYIDDIKFYNGVTTAGTAWTEEGT